MSILTFHDLEGDIVAVESMAVVAVRVGRVAERVGLVTLISVIGATFAVREPTDEVIALWREARGDQPKAHPDAIGWKVHPVVAGSDG